MTEFNVDQTGEHIRATLEGVDITSACKEITVTVDPYMKKMRVELDLRIDQVEITSLAESDISVLVNIPDDVVEVLELLGWIKTDRRTYRIPRTEGDYG